MAAHRRVLRSVRRGVATRAASAEAGRRSPCAVQRVRLARIVRRTKVAPSPRLRAASRWVAAGAPSAGSWDATEARRLRSHAVHGQRLPLLALRIAAELRFQRVEDALARRCAGACRRQWLASDGEPGRAGAGAGERRVAGASPEAIRASLARAHFANTNRRVAVRPISILDRSVRRIGRVEVGHRLRRCRSRVDVDDERVLGILGGAAVAAGPCQRGAGRHRETSRSTRPHGPRIHRAGGRPRTGYSDYFFLPVSVGAEGCAARSSPSLSLA